MESVLLNEVMKLLGIRHTRTTPLHPSGNPVERLNRTLKEHLTVMIDDRQSDWDRQAQLFLLGYRAMPHAVTGISPCMLMFGRHLTLPADLEYGVPFFEKVDMYSGEYAVRLRETLWELHEIVRQTVRNESMKTKIRYDAKAKPPDFRPRDVVWLYNPKKVRGLTRKLQTKWEGPYSVIRCLNDVVIQIQKTPNGRIKTIHADRLRLVERPTQGPPQNPITTKVDISTEPPLRFPGLRSERNNQRKLYRTLTVSIPADGPEMSLTSRIRPQKSNPTELSGNICGLRGRKKNARRVFPMLTVSLIQPLPTTSSLLPTRNVHLNEGSARIFIPTSTSTRKGPHLFLAERTPIPETPASRAMKPKMGLASMEWVNIPAVDRDLEVSEDPQLKTGKHRGCRGAKTKREFRKRVCQAPLSQTTAPNNCAPSNTEKLRRAT